MKIWLTLVAVSTGLATFGCSGRVTAAPAQIIFLRHAEKPDVGPELTERGRERAKALVRLFTQDPRALEHGPAVAIFAMKPTGKNGSVRAIETMAATARALGVKLNAHHARDDVAPLVSAIMTAPAFEGKTVIVCWEHGVIPEMLTALGWQDGPQKWPGDAYDRLWVLDFAQGKPSRFRDLPQNLLPGDSTK